MEIFKHYNELLKTYTEEIILFEKEKENIKKEDSTVRWEPKSVINSRMFHFDEWLINPFHNYFCYEQKHKILPLLIKFISAHNKLTESEIEKFEKDRTQNNYQEYLDELWKPHINFLEFLNELKKERENLIQTFKYPAKPSRPNAHRQLAEFEKKKDEYWKDVESNQKCIQEISDWKKIYETS